jgi:wyosine [tRNA(Phe)-imidazoG37] synthetase (radical SAM superfamily)
MISPLSANKKKKNLFGPVSSRRLGFSLGVDIIPYKTCTFDCIYCELGATTRKTADPVDEIPPEEILEELEQTLAEAPPLLDYITVTGSGETTLHPRLGEIIEGIKKRSPVPVALLTNGSLLYQEGVLEAAAQADVVLPSLDAPDEEVYQAVNRPHPSIPFDRLTEGLIRLGNRPGGRVWLEVLLLKGINDDPLRIARLGDWIRAIRPEKVQLNTVARPPVDPTAHPLTPEDLQDVRNTLKGCAEIELIVQTQKDRSQFRTKALEREALGLLARRPCTEEEIARSLGISHRETRGLLEQLLQAGKIIPERFGRQGFYRALPQDVQ